MPQRLDQHLAITAANAVPEMVSRDLLTVLRKVPVLIHNNGLAMAATYLLAKADKPSELDRHWRVAKALLEEASDVIRLDSGSGDPLVILNRLTTVDSVDSARYAIAQRRAQELAVWLARIGSARATTENH